MNDVGWVSVESAEQEAAALLVIRSSWPRLVAAEEFLAGAKMTADASSSLGIDTAYLGPIGSGLHHAALNSAVDALRTTRALLDTEGQVTFPLMGLYPLFRAALENAALAVYLLAPESRDDRLERAFREIAGDVRLREKFAAHFEDPDVGAGKRDRWHQILADMLEGRPTVGPASVQQLKPATITSIVQEADAVVQTDAASERHTYSMPLLALWQVQSGLSHGRHWATMQAHARSKPVVEADGSVSSLTFTARSSLVSVSLVRALDVLETALRLYGQRSTWWSARPEDAAEQRRGRTSGPGDVS